MTILARHWNGFDGIHNLDTILHMGFPNLITPDVFAIATHILLVIAGIKEQRFRRGHGTSHSEVFSSHAVEKEKALGIFMLSPQKPYE